MRNGGAEECEDAITGALHDVTIVTLGRVDHQLERRIDNRARLFGVEILLQFRRPLDIGEQRGDRLALAVQRRGVIRFPQR